MKPVLLLGIGNTLRQDDGAGAAVALRFHDHPWIESHAVHQLLPEHIERFHGRELILFVDAAIDRNQVVFEPLMPGTCQPPKAAGHFQHPYDLICLYQWLYQAWPTSWLVSLPAAEWELGEQLSSVGRQAVQQAVGAIQSTVTGMMAGHHRSQFSGSPSVAI